MKKLLIQVFRFGLVGGLCFVIDYGLLALLTELAGINYLVSSAVAFSVSVTVNYLLSMHFVFESKENVDRFREVVLFVALSVVGLGLNQLLMWLGTEIIGVYYLLTKLAATAIVMVYNFITRKLLLEKHGFA